MAKRLNVPISSARSTLFQLVDLVRKSGGDSIVVLEQRGESENVALVREARLDYLEERVMQIDRQQPAAFKLGGSLTSGMSDAALQQALHELRLEWSAQPESREAIAPARRKRTAARSSRK